MIQICSMQFFMFFCHQSPFISCQWPMAREDVNFSLCHVEPTQGEEDAEGIAFNLFLDLRWHSRALFQMTRSYAGDSDTASETLWVRVLLNDVECFRWKRYGTGCVETKTNTTLVLAAICGVGTRDCTCVLLHLIA